MKKLFRRLLTFIIGMPILIFTALFLPQFNHFAFACIVIGVSLIGATEMQNILKQKNIVISKFEAGFFGFSMPTAVALCVCFGAPFFVVPAVLLINASWILAAKTFSPQDKLHEYVGRCAAGFSTLLYPGCFMAWIIPLGLARDSRNVILTYLLVTFINDAGAWLCGMLFGKNNRGIVAASPNKSVAGFAGGIFISTIIGAGAAHFFPGAFTPAFFTPFVSGACLGFFSGIAATLGDLAESSLKRSADLKDSGRVIPGRGGMLDCIDSLSLAAPVFYICFRIFFK